MSCFEWQTRFILKSVRDREDYWSLLFKGHLIDGYATKKSLELTRSLYFKTPVVRPKALTAITQRATNYPTQKRN